MKLNTRMFCHFAEYRIVMLNVVMLSVVAAVIQYTINGNETNNPENFHHKIDKIQWSLDKMKGNHFV